VYGDCRDPTHTVVRRVVALSNTSAVSLPNRDLERIVVIPLHEHNLNEQTAPELSNPVPHHPMAGNWSDDDGPATDDYFEAPTHAPISHDTLPDPTAKIELPIPTRLLCRSLVLGSIDGVNPTDPIPILPADVNRKALLMVVTVAGSASGVKIGSAKSDVYYSPVFAANGNIGYDLSGHTGALWVYNSATAVADKVTVDVTAIST